MRATIAILLYTCQPFLSKIRGIFILRVPGFFVENPIIYEDVTTDFRRRPEEFRSSARLEKSVGKRELE